MRGSRLAVIGAGLAGVTVGRAAADAGANVVLFEKARGLGGRMSTRREPDFAFDHGAQYFTTQSTGFRLEVSRWARAGVAAAWDARFAEVEGGTWQQRTEASQHWVAVPGMSAAVKFVAAGLPVEPRCRIARLERRADRWGLVDDGGRDVGEFDAVAVATPAAQAVGLLAHAPELAAKAAAVREAPCWAVMLAFDARLPVPFDAADVRDGPLQWVARDSSKPGRTTPPGTETWVLHASAAWSAANVEAAPGDVAEALLEAFGAVPGADAAPRPRLLAAHRWLYARVEVPAGAPCLWDRALAIGACGDWCAGARVEAAWSSGRALAEAWGGARGGRATHR